MGSALDFVFEEGILNEEDALSLIETQRPFIGCNKFWTDVVALVTHLPRDLYGYPPGYVGPKSVSEQIDILRRLFSNLGADKEFAEWPLPSGAEGHFAIPRWQAIGETYVEATEKALNLLGVRNDDLDNCLLRDKLGAKHLRKSRQSTKMLEALSGAQGNNNILVVPAQLGLRYRGRSVYRAHELFKVNEFGLGVFEVACILLTHAECLVGDNDLRIVCAGDEFAPWGDESFSHLICFYLFRDKIMIQRFGVKDADDSSGSASAFLPFPH